MTDENMTTSEAVDATEPTHSVETHDVGDGEVSSPGNRQPEESAEYWKQRYSEARKGGEAAARERQQLLNQMQQQQSMMQYYAQQPQQAQPQIGSDYLTPDERSMLEKAEEELDLKTLGKVKDLQAERRQYYQMQQMQSQWYQNAGMQFKQMSEVEFYKRNADILSDKVLQREILDEALRIQSDPVESIGIEGIGNPQYNIPTPDGVPVNRNVIAMVVRQKRAELKKAKNSALGRARSNSIGAPERTTGEPGHGQASGSFNPMVHLREGERHTIDLMNKRSSALENWGYKQYWESLPKEVREARLREGRADISIEDHMRGRIK